MDDNTNKEILNELKQINCYIKKHKKINKTLLIIFVPIMIILGSILIYIDVTKKIKSESEIYYRYDVSQFLENGKNQEALKLANEWMDINSNSPKPHKYLGFIYNQIGDLKKSEESFKKAYELFPCKDNKDYLDAIRNKIKNT